MQPHIPGHAAILAYFGGYAPAERRTYELAILAEGPTRLVSIHVGTIPGVQPYAAAIKAAQGRRVHDDDLRDRAHLEVSDIGVGQLQAMLDTLLTWAGQAHGLGLPLRQRRQIVGGVYRYCFTLPDLPGGCHPASPLPDQLTAGVAVEHPQLWVPGAPRTRLPLRHQARAAHKDHPLWNA